MYKDCLPSLVIIPSSDASILQSQQLLSALQYSRTPGRKEGFVTGKLLPLALDC